MGKIKIVDSEDLYEGNINSDDHYKARKFTAGVFEKLEGIAPDSGTSLRFIFEGASTRMKAVIRQVALRAHFPNFNEEDQSPHRTTLVVAYEGIYDNKGLLSCLSDLSGGGCLGNLPKQCKTECHMLDGSLTSSRIPDEASYIDIQIEIVGLGDRSFNGAFMTATDTVIIRESDLEGISLTPEDRVIDVRRAKLVNMFYNIGMNVPLPPTDPSNIPHYANAIKIHSHFKQQEVQDLWDKVISKEKKLSNVACADCLTERIKGIYKKNKFCKIVEDNIDSLARCEHTRWNVEELILGFRSLTPEEENEHDNLPSNRRADFRRILKENEKAHYDLRSYSDLKRKNPDDMKYDYFLMLSIPSILKDSLPVI